MTEDGVLAFVTEERGVSLVLECGRGFRFLELLIKQRGERLVGKVYDVEGCALLLGDVLFEDLGELGHFGVEMLLQCRNFPQRACHCVAFLRVVFIEQKWITGALLCCGCVCPVEQNLNSLIRTIPMEGHHVQCISDASAGHCGLLQ